MKIKLGEEELAVKVLDRHVTEIDGGAYHKLGIYCLAQSLPQVEMNSFKNR